MGHPEATGMTEEDLLRARFYELLTALLAAPPSADLLERLSQLDGDDSPLGSALAALAAAAKAATPEAVTDEYNALFIGMTRGELVPFGSYYLTGNLHDRPLAVLRDDLAALGIARAEGVAEPEDSMASLCEIMRAQIEGAFGPPSCLGEQKRFFDTHLAPWAGRFFTDLEQAKAADFYAPVGTLGRVFFDIESQGLALTVRD